mgnify:CR=1 FL=1
MPRQASALPISPVTLERAVLSGPAFRPRHERSLLGGSPGGSSRKDLEAQMLSSRRKRCRSKKLLQEGELKDLVVRLLTQQQWSPEQIAQRIELERGKKLVSYATIYRALHKGLMESKGTRKNRHGRYPMEKHLRRKGWRGKGKGQKSRHFVHQTIEERPEEANRRSEIGHWEGDLVYSSFYKLYVVTLVDRKSRFLLTGISYSRKAQEVSDVICRLLKELPEKHVRSLTLDRGSEFSEHGQITKAFPFPANLFCASHVAVGKRIKRADQRPAAAVHSQKHLSSSVFCRAIGRVYRKAESSSSQMPQLELPL